MNRNQTSRLAFGASRVIAVGLCLLGCVRDRAWTADELRNWCRECAERSRFCGPLYYRGSDDEFHYFICRSMDAWVSPRVKRREIALEDVRPPLGSSTDQAFPGYYVVDPERGFERVELHDRKSNFLESQGPHNTAPKLPSRPVTGRAPARLAPVRLAA